MTGKSRFSVLPTTGAMQRKPVDPDKIAAFAQAANTPHAITSETTGSGTPEQPNAAYWGTLDNKRRGGINVFNLRFTDREAAQLKFITDRNEVSRHEFCLKAIKEAIAKELL